MPYGHGTLRYQALAAHATTVLARLRLLATPARYVHHARRWMLKIPSSRAWAPHLATAFERLRALDPA